MIHKFFGIVMLKSSKGKNYKTLGTMTTKTCGTSNENQNPPEKIIAEK